MCRARVFLVLCKVVIHHTVFSRRAVKIVDSAYLVYLVDYVVEYLNHLKKLKKLIIITFNFLKQFTINR